MKLISSANGKDKSKAPFAWGEFQLALLTLKWNMAFVA